MESGGWFKLDNEAVDVLLPKVGPAAFAVYCCLARRANNQTRRCWPSIRRIMEDTGLSERMVFYHLNRLKGAGAISTENRPGSSTIYTLTRRSGGATDCTPSPLGGATDCRDPCNPLHPTPATDCTQNKTKENNPQRNKTHRRALRFDAADMEIAEWMLGLIRGHLPEFKKPDLDKWANLVRLIREQDGRTTEQIRHLWQWLQTEPEGFWRTVVLCPDKFRQKWDTLTARSRRTTTSSKRSFANGPGQRYDPEAAKRDPTIGRM